MRRIVEPRQWAKFCGSVLHVLATHICGKELVLELFLNTLRFERRNTFGANLRARDNKPAQLIARKESPCHGSESRHAGAFGAMSENGDSSLVIDADRLEMLAPDNGMLFRSRMPLPIKVVQKARNLPALLFPRIELDGVRSHARGDALHVDAQRRILNPLVHQSSCFVKIHAWSVEGRPAERNMLHHGIDAIEVARIARSLEQHGEKFVARVFTPGEQAYSEPRSRRVEHYAARFAAKEAVLKAIGTGWRDGIAWTDVEVVHDPAGKPGVALHGEAARVAAELGITRWSLSLTHTAELAFASAIGWSSDNGD